MKNDPKYVVIHCTDVSYNTVKDQFASTNTYHRDERQFPKSSLGFFVGYHVLITNGKEYVCRLDTDEGAHCNQGFDGKNVFQVGSDNNPHAGWSKDAVSMNFQSLGVCVGFDGDKEDMLEKDYVLLQKRVWQWQDKYNISNDKVFFHRMFNIQKTCPGLRIGQEWLTNLLERPLPPPVKKEKNLSQLIDELVELVISIVKAIRVKVSGE